MKLLYLFIFMAFNMSVFGQVFKESLDSLMKKYHNQTHTSYSLLLMQKGKVVYQNSVGFHKADAITRTTETSNYRMASVSKQFTAAAIFLLERVKKLRFEQTLSDFFSDFSPVGKKITIHSLLSHTSGITDYEELIDTTIKNQLSDMDILNMVKGIDNTYFNPGTQFRYSNTAYCLLSLIVEKASGMPFYKYCERHIFTPLGMMQTVWYGQEIPNRVYGYAKDGNGKIEFRDQSITSATLGDGGLYTSIADYGKWYLGRKSKLGMDFEKMIALSSANIVGDHAYTFGWFFEKDGNNKPKVILHSGATCGFSNIVIEIPAQELLIAYFTNLADNHDSFIQIESVLQSYGLLDTKFSYRLMHDATH